jgi:hypothetical protein
VDHFNCLLHTSVFSFILAAGIGESVFAHFEKIVSEEESSDGVLDSFHHLEDVFKDSVRAFIVALNVDTTDGDEEIKPWDDAGGVLDGLVQVDHSSTSAEIVFEVVFEF